MKTYLDTLQYVLDHGKPKEDRTGTGTLSVFGYQNRYNLQDSFPAVTTKKLAWKSVLSELLWFLEGSSDERRLAEILYGKDRSELAGKRTIWTDNAMADYWKGKARYEGDLGRVYGVQWRSWQFSEGVIDQINTVINQIKNDPTNRRIIISAWNVGELNQMALPPCHLMSQFYVRDNEFLDCQMYQRSADAFLGVPFNIASYATLTHMIAQVTGLKAGEFIHTFGDLHIYTNHIDQVREQLQREPLSPPTLWLNPEVKDIDSFEMNDIQLIDYESHPPIKAKMAV